MFYLIYFCNLYFLVFIIHFVFHQHFESILSFFSLLSYFKFSILSFLISYMTEVTSRRCSVRNDVLRNFAKFTGKHLCQSLFFNKVLINFAKLCYRTPPVAASVMVLVSLPHVVTSIYL